MYHENSTMKRLVYLLLELKKRVFLMHKLEKNLIQNTYDTYRSTFKKKNWFSYFPNRCSYCTNWKKKQMFRMHELITISYKVCTTHSTQLFRGKKMVFTLPKEVFLLHGLQRKKDAPNARTGNNFKSSLIEE